MVCYLMAAMPNEQSGRYRIRTCDPLGVSEVHYRCAKRPSRLDLGIVVLQRLLARDTGISWVVIVNRLFTELPSSLIHDY